MDYLTVQNTDEIGDNWDEMIQGYKDGKIRINFF